MYTLIIYASKIVFLWTAIKNVECIFLSSENKRDFLNFRKYTSKSRRLETENSDENIVSIAKSLVN